MLFIFLVLRGPGDPRSSVLENTRNHKPWIRHAAGPTEPWIHSPVGPTHLHVGYCSSAAPNPAVNRFYPTLDVPTLLQTPPNTWKHQSEGQKFKSPEAGILVNVGVLGAAFDSRNSL